MEYQLLDRMSYQHFCGLTDSACVLDRTTVWTFENRIGEVGAQALFDGMEQQLLKQGYKLSVNVDRRYKVIRKIETDTASTHDSQHFDAVLDSDNTCREVYADKGYPSAAREAQLKEAGYRNYIQRKGARNHPLLARQEKRNQRIDKTRARADIFAGIE
ncbi:hypothetical protein NTGBS_1050009 [Candidatus Nitrotoga sp. BS]|nr:hypothetical protein NTGBS_1050009 [Candidatus Nitrotoga sp. BS]